MEHLTCFFLDMHDFRSHLLFLVACSSNVLQLTRHSGVTGMLTDYRSSQCHFLRLPPPHEEQSYLKTSLLRHFCTSLHPFGAYPLYLFIFPTQGDPSVYLACLLSTTLPPQQIFKNQRWGGCWTSHSTLRLSDFESNNEPPVQETHWVSGYFTVTFQRIKETCLDETKANLKP